MPTYRHVVRYEAKPGSQGLVRIGFAGWAWLAEDGRLAIELQSNQEPETGVFYSIEAIDREPAMDERARHSHDPGYDQGAGRRESIYGPFKRPAKPDSRS